MERWISTSLGTVRYSGKIQKKFWQRYLEMEIIKESRLTAWLD